MGFQLISGFPATTGDDYQLNTISVLRHASSVYPEVEVASRREDGSIFRYSYQEAYERVCKLANALERLGVKPGDRVGVMDWNTYRHFELYMAISGIGAVILQMNPRLGHEDIAYVVGHSETRFIFVTDSLLPVIEAIANKVKTVEGFVVITDKDLGALGTTLSPLSSYEELLSVEPPDYPWRMIDEKSAYSACYTSGTTGKPKGVYYSHRSIYLHTTAVALSFSISASDVLLQMVPMFHAQGWGFWLAAPMTGAKLVFSGRYTLDTTGGLVDLIVSEKPTVTAGAPALFMPMLHYIRTMPQKPDFSGLRIASGATEPPLAMMREFWELCRAEFIHAYGATETSPVVTVNHLKPSLRGWSKEQQWENQKKQGLPVAGVEMKIVGADGKETVRDGQTVGELLIRGPWIASSYYNDPRTADCFRDGYWISGDAGTVDRHGYVKITDRVKDMIKSGGEWISSIDLENAIMAHPGVLEASVVGLPHPKWQERPVALVVPKAETKDKITKADILEFIRPGFAKWQLPDEILFVDSIPKTSVGKFSKKTMREQYADLFKSIDTGA
ncbi:MAG: long-chain fatty acid--CoA ligase [Deltaproteobacteria bacterium]|jgi:fatty-acyl-CoA synthase|nr:long-chain fatty acid--CoA ligase [Deltaproteobacteria bacterium]